MSNKFNRVVFTNGSSVLSIVPNSGLTLLSFFQNDGTTLSDILARNISQTGQYFRLNNNVAGTPSLNAGIEVERGSSVDSQLLWDESTDDWKGGPTDNLKALARVSQVSITNANLSSGNYVFNHNTGKYPVIQVLDNSLNHVGMTVTHNTVNQLTVNFNNVLVSGSLVGTWIILVNG